ncbi:nuclear transport factor 2 family protein [Paractinoplanes lichenicola]|uniref:Nuclear transport factor 2 family protein n=1 Tax=Paractinoplanes lichenicola TaxID=2802976 RepID=A0ABS1VVU6_9ACTN|nr:nuclear transport factor 2 family protein [Actinoplanes lichenicola]MBL7258605.1 nuclear transport factor 2 family protein [Actinoplanes lichenicola]
MDRLTELATNNLLRVFGERDPQARAAVIAETYAENVVFTDSEEELTGRDALDAKAQKLLDRTPGFVFRPAGPVQTVGNLAMLAWELGPADAPAVVTGVDILLVENDVVVKLYTIVNEAPAA